MDFALFLLVNCTLFLRPAEIIPDLQELPLYNCFILAALAAAMPKLIPHLNPENLVREPMTVCVLGMFVAIVMSHMVRLDTWSAREYGLEFLKIVIYFLLLTSIIDSNVRLQRFLCAIALLAAATSAIAIAHYFEYINVPSLRILQYAESVDPETDEPILIQRMQATGIFSDPNDLSMIAVLGAIISTFALGNRQLGAARLAWLLPLGVLLVTIALTKSRGGILALGIGVVVLSYVRFGRLATIAAAGLFVPVAGLLLAGRGSGMDGGTGSDRAELWSEGLLMLKRSPLFGVGSNNYPDESGIGLVAHNSFIHCFGELGMFGGSCFLGICWFGVLSLWKLGRGIERSSIFYYTADSSFRVMQPYIFAMLLGACTSMLSVSRAYVVPTYLVFGIVNAYCLEAQRQGMPTAVRLTTRRIAELLPLSILFLAAVYLFIKLSVR